LGQDGRKVIGIKRAMCLTDGSPRITVSANLNPLIAPARHPTGDTTRCISGDPHAFARRKMPIDQTGGLYRSLDEIAGRCAANSEPLRNGRSGSDDGRFVS
jgi:hypothetical protein